MRKMKKILAWLTVLTVNVSMMPMPTVAAATATDASTASNEETTTSDATKEATQAQEVAKKAVEKASKTVTTTAAKKTTKETKKATSTKKSQSDQSLENTIEEGIFTDRDQTKIDVSDYDASKSEVKSATKEVLKDNNASKLVNVIYDTNAEGKVETLNVETDPTYATAMNEIDEINEKSARKATDEELQDAYSAYGALQNYYESKQEYFGIAAPYFSSKDSEGPIRALLSVADIEFDDIGTITDGSSKDNSVKTVTGLIQGYYYALTEMTDEAGTYTQSHEKGSMYDTYGKKLLEVRDQALEVVKGKTTTAEKLLALNDWLGNYANFDMGYINNQMKEDLGKEDLQALSTLADDSQGSKDDQAAAAAAMKKLIAGVIRSSAFGVLVDRKSVCLSYTAAYNYLVQCAFPEIYKENGEWKKKDDINGTWEVKKDSEGNVEKVDGKTQYQLTADSKTPTYMVDYVRIQWNSKVKMYGEKQDFNNPHYFSAVKVDGKWYYVDSCYNDIYVECLQRNRVETDGNLPHSYFLISDTSLRKQFDGNYQYIDTLYKDDSTDKTYEDSWVSKAQGPVYNDGTYYYYVKNTSTYSTSGSSVNYQEGNDQLVRRKMSDGLLSGEDKILVDYKTGEGLIKEGKDLITEGYKEDTDVNDKKYPGLTHSAALYNNALYLNLSNKIYKYDLSDNSVTLVKEYNEVSAKQDSSKTDFPGMSFTITTNDDKDKVHTVYNHPIAGLAIKDDGKMYVAIATNFTDCAKYKYEETNYNSEYMDYTFNGQHYQRGGNNDNQEFMWSANFTEALDMSHVAGTEHTYEKVEVAPTCTEDGYTEERCTTCGEIKADSKKATDAKATGHHYIKAHEFYYTPKDDSKDYSETNRNEGDFYLCTDCLDAQESLPEGETAGHTYGNATATLNDDNTEAEVTVSCTECEGKELDALLDDQNKDTQELTKTAKTTDIKVEKPEGFDCEKGGEVTYVATATIDGKEYKASKKVTVEAGKHTYGEPTFKWSDDNKTCKATFKCTVCGTEHTEDCTVTSKIVAATCTTKGSTTYTATVSMNGKDYTDTKETDVVDPLGHKYGEPTFKWSDDHKTCTATFTCENDNSHVETVDCTITPETTKAVTCEEDGEIVYTASCEFGGKTYTNPETYKEVVKSSGHQYKDPVYTWSTDDEGNKVCVAAFTCSICGKTENVPGTVKAETTKEVTCTEDGSIKYTATISFNDQTYTTSKIETVQKTGHKYDDNGVCTVCGHKKPVITLKAKKAVYTGKAISIDEPTITEGEVVNLNYSYYSDKDCKNEISEPVDPGVYYVTVTADAGSDNAGVTSNTVTLTIAPQATKVTSVANATSNVTVSWNKVSKASGYYVYRSTDGKKFTKIATVKSASTVKYNDKKATKNGQKYVYKVVTYYNGNQTVSSAYSAAKTGYRLSIMKVSSLTNKKGKKAYIKWTKNSKSTGYQIKYVTGKSKAKTVKASSKAKTKTISKLKKGKTYKVRIRSYKKVSNVTYYSAWSKQKSVKIKK